MLLSKLHILFEIIFDGTTAEYGDLTFPNF